MSFTEHALRAVWTVMGKYSCPICATDVAPEKFGLSASGEELRRDADGLTVQRRVCPACGTRLERTVFEAWHVDSREFAWS